MPKYGWRMLVLCLLCAGLWHQSVRAQTVISPDWAWQSTANGDFPPTLLPNQQTSLVIADLNGDGLDDFVVGGRGGAPSMVYYLFNGTSWDQYLMEAQLLPIEAGGTAADIDGDGDLDILQGSDGQLDRIWWWENPGAPYDPAVPWQRHLIKDSGNGGHHDQIFGDIDGDGQLELIFWHQGVPELSVAEIPANPRNPDPGANPALYWPYSTIASVNGEGLDIADMDGDGVLDLLAGGSWYRYNGTGYDRFQITTVGALTAGRIQAGQFRVGGAPEVLMVAGDAVGPLTYFECVDAGGNPANPRTLPTCWQPRDLLPYDVDRGHSFDVGDLNGDGFLDFFVAEMRLGGGNPDSFMKIFFGDGAGNFVESDIAQGFGNHESKLADLDGDGDLDIVGKNFNWQAGRLDIFLNGGTLPGFGVCTVYPMDDWSRTAIDTSRPLNSVFVRYADLDGDGLQDILAGDAWYANPGTVAGAWTKTTFNSYPGAGNLSNIALTFDFDGDGDQDVLGTDGTPQGRIFTWAQNDGAGNFTRFNNIANPGMGDFLQGVVVGNFRGLGTEVILSWHDGGTDLQRLVVPPAATVTTAIWAVEQAAPNAAAQFEELSAGDIDGDGRPDLLTGTRWLQNTPGGYVPYDMIAPLGAPDRNRLADINGDGRLDAVVGYEATNGLGRLAWYGHGGDPTLPWTETLIASVIGPMSVDVRDMDGDGDIDVLVGEHYPANPAAARLLLYENADGSGTTWTEHLIYTGDEHHDGAQVVDIDNDGDLDVTSIGWQNNLVVVYENRANETCPRLVLPPRPRNTAVAAPAPALGIFDPVISKVADPPFAIPGEAVTWTLVITNPGTLPVTNVTMTDVMPPEVEIISVAATSGSISFSGNTVSFLQPIFFPGDSITITINTRVRDTASVPFVILNTACTASDQTAPHCDDASVLSVTALPRTGEARLPWLLPLLGLVGGLGLVNLLLAVYWRRRAARR